MRDMKLRKYRTTSVTNTEIGFCEKVVPKAISVAASPPVRLHSQPIPWQYCICETVGVLKPSCHARARLLVI